MEGVKVLWQEVDIGDIAASGFSATEKDDWFEKDDPLGNLVEGHGYQVIDWPGE